MQILKILLVKNKYNGMSTLMIDSQYWIQIEQLFNNESTITISNFILQFTQLYFF